MAKDGTWYRLGGFIATVVIILSGIVASFVWAQADTKAVDVKAVNLKKEGCDPSKGNREDILVIQTDLKYIIKGIDEINEKL